MQDNKIIDSNTLLEELVKCQRKKIASSKKLSFNDMKRICKHINTSIFNKQSCSIWQGYITNNDHPEKGIYINFYFNGKKVALHRILYINYIDNLDNDEYLKYECENIGKCCNVNHLKKFKYKRNECNEDDNIIGDNNTNNNNTNNIIDSNLDIIFD